MVLASRCSIPSVIAALPQIQNIYLGDNKLIGSIPEEIGAATQLRSMYASVQALGWLTQALTVVPVQLARVQLLELHHSESRTSRQTRALSSVS